MPSGASSSPLMKRRFPYALERVVGGELLSLRDDAALVVG